MACARKSGEGLVKGMSEGLQFEKCMEQDTGGLDSDVSIEVLFLCPSHAKAGRGEFHCINLSARC
jgi:hypothetical protein